jgi:DNA-binding NtrC family response regulator
MTPRTRVFLLDDDDLIVTLLARTLRGEGYEVEARTDPAGATDAIRAFSPDVVMLDLKLPGVSGLDILGELEEQGTDAQVVMLSSDASADSAVRAMKMGAVDYLTKPFDLDEVRLIVASLVEKGRLEQEVAYLRKISGPELARREIIGISGAIRELREGAEKLAQARVPMILITGENGTGKELVARYVHDQMHESQTGRLAPFIGINCAALPEQLIESELFGHEKGAFTDARAEKKGVFELASGGTILLDEIGEMNWNLQAKLLRVLEERTIRRVGGRRDIPIDATVLATTNRDLEAAIRGGTFRVDLFYRLATFSLHLPPLREHPEDLLPIAKHFLARFASRYGRPAPAAFSSDAERLLRSYPWPGNVRELRNVVERIVVLGRGDVVRPEDLPKEVLQMSADAAASAAPLASDVLLPDGGLSLDDLERSLIEQALARVAGNKAQAAKLLGMSYDSFRYQAKKFGLDAGGHGSGAA